MRGTVLELVVEFDEEGYQCLGEQGGQGQAGQNESILSCDCAVVR